MHPEEGLRIVIVIVVVGLRKVVELWRMPITRFCSASLVDNVLISGIKSYHTVQYSVSNVTYGLCRVTEVRVNVHTLELDYRLFVRFSSLT